MQKMKQLATYCFAGIVNGAEVTLQPTNQFSGYHKIDAPHSYFAKKFTAENCQLESANFKEAWFDDQVNLSDAKFYSGVTFEGVQFREEAVFTQAIFLGDHTKEACFRSVHFNTEADFLNAEFKIKANFAKFKGSTTVIFRSAKFTTYAEFRQASFCGPVYFKDAIFHSNAQFINTSFMKYVDFKNTKFYQEINFEGAVFFEQADFSSSRKIEDPTEESFSYTSFENALFFRWVTFANRQFSAATRFRGAWFFDIANFHGCTLHKDTSFTLDQFSLPPNKKGLDKKFVARAKTRLAGSYHQTAVDHHTKQLNEGKWSGRDIPQDQESLAIISEEFERAFRTSKDHMEQARDRTSEQAFFTKELQSRVRVKRPDVTMWERWAARDYGDLSDYGASIVRPLQWLLLFGGYFGVIYWALLDKFIGGFSMSMQVMMPLSLGFYPLRKLNADVLVAQLDGISPVCLMGLTALVSLQAFLSLALWFLFFLALRRRFQIS